MNMGIIGLGHAFKKQYKALLLNENINFIELCDIDKGKIIKYKCKNNYMMLNSSTILIATSPSFHMNIIKNLVKTGKKFIVEKPAVININELKELKLLKIRNYYNSLHFSFGLEIDYFINNIKSKPNKIYCFISDNYVTNNKINESAIKLCGSYLDETINPLSAVARMFSYKIKYVSSTKKKYDVDDYDYYSNSNFLVEDIPVNIEVLWNNELSRKYIDLYYDGFIIRLDSMNQSVINMTTNKVLFVGKGDRMTNHYIGVFNDYFKKANNYDISIKLHEELLKGVNIDD